MRADEFIVHVCSSGPETLLTNAFLVETTHAVVAVDAMMTVSDARALRARCDAIGKPLLAVLITHGHPDHYNGVGELIRGMGDVPVTTTRAVDAVIHRIIDTKEMQWKPIFGDEWPSERIFPNHFVEDGETLVFDGVPFTVRELGEGESHCDLYWTVGVKSRVAFVGDLVFNGVHAFMNDGHSAAWLKSLDVLAVELADVTTIYTGHGKPGTPAALIPAQRSYITHYRDIVRALVNGATTLDEKAKFALRQAMYALLPTRDLDVFIAAGANAVAAELAAEQICI